MLHAYLRIQRALLRSSMHIQIFILDAKDSVFSPSFETSLRLVFRFPTNKN